MKALQRSTLGIIVLTSAILSTNNVKAAVVNNTTSKSYIHFIADEGITKPVDPTDPDNPNPPSPIDPEDPGNGGTGNAGSLTLDYVLNIQFGTQQITSGNATYHAKNKDPFVQVSDKRGTGEGWSLIAKASEFRSDKGKVLAGAVLSLKNGIVKSHSSNVSGPPIANDIVFDNTDGKKVMVAETDAGRGTWIDVISGTEGANRNIQLNVLAGSADSQTNYTATIMWELSNAPS